MRDRFQLTPRGIIESLGLARPIYAQTASYRHFGGTDPMMPWEKVAEVAAEQGERARSREALMIKAKRRKSSGYAAKETAQNS